MSVTNHPISRQENAFHIDEKTGEHIYPMTDPEINNLKSHSIAIVEIEPGKATTNHYHPAPFEETYTIISGIGIMILEGTSYEIKAGDVIVINSNVKHKLINTGSEMLKLICVCCPPWNPDCKIDV